MNLLAALPVLSGGRDVTATSTATYPADPRQITDWQLGHTASPPAGLGTTPVTVPYRAFHPETSPIADLTYALGSVLGDAGDGRSARGGPTAVDRPSRAARELHRAGARDEASRTTTRRPPCPPTATFWDDLFVQLAPSRTPRGSSRTSSARSCRCRTLGLEPALATYFIGQGRRLLRHERPQRAVGEPHVPGQSTLALRRRRSIARSPTAARTRARCRSSSRSCTTRTGLAICTKDGATVPISVTLAGVNVNFVYPTDPVYTPLLCGIVGSTRAVAPREVRHLRLPERDERCSSTSS